MEERWMTRGSRSPENGAGERGGRTESEEGGGGGEDGDGNFDDPDMGGSLLRRELDEKNRLIEELRERVRDAKERERLEAKERDSRYNKMRAEVYENSMGLIHQLQSGHKEALDASNQRISFLEKELEIARAEAGEGGGVEEIARLRAEVEELTQAIEELEREKDHEVAAARRVGVPKGAGAALGSSSGGADAAKLAKMEAEIASLKERLREAVADREGAEEERERLQHRLCDAEERNTRLASEVKRMGDALGKMQERFECVSMEHEILLEMDARNRCLALTDHRIKTPHRRSFGLAVAASGADAPRRNEGPLKNCSPPIFRGGWDVSDSDFRRFSISWREES